jgi:hypothetical protein
VIVQWCVKGLSLGSDAEAKSIIDSGEGLLSQWWRDARGFQAYDVKRKLTPANIDMHVNQFHQRDPATGRPFYETTPFISLTAGTLERDTVLATNIVHSARRVALHFGSRFGADSTAYLFHCWVVVGPRRAVVVEGVAEEVRDLNSWRDYSAFQTEGEVAAKVRVPVNQIACCEKWEVKPSHSLLWSYDNPDFTPPETLSNIREMLV